MSAEERQIVREHLQHKEADRDGQGRRYGWTDAEVDALIIALRGAR